MLVNGKALAQDREESIRMLIGDRKLSIGIYALQASAVTASFVRIKKRVADRLGISILETDSFDEACSCDGVIVQLPLPKIIDTDTIRNAIPLKKDIDCLSDRAFQEFEKGSFPPPPVPRAMREILAHHDVSVSGKQVVVVGQGRLVGLPAATMFRQMGASVSVVRRGEPVAEKTETADIVVLGAGEPNLLTPSMIKEGVIILDAGTSEASGVVVGDADPRCEGKASLMTPVPGGIGPIAVVEIFANLLALKQ